MNGSDGIGYKAGYVALLGRPNVGKSTLLNRLLDDKLSITSAKPQTTRHAILGIKTRDDAQLVYVDTPGLHRDAPRAINRYMNRAASGALGYADVAVLVVAVPRWTDADQHVLDGLASFSGPVLLAVNKIDRLDGRRRTLLPLLDGLARRYAFADIVPVSALKRDNLATLESRILAHLPHGDPLFGPGQVTTISERLLAAELIREQLIRALHAELPYALTVEIERFEYRKRGRVLNIDALIWVERPGQKAIVIGERGTTLKAVGEQARRALERRLECKVFLQTWVKVRAGWSDDERALRQFGYRDEP